MLESKYLCTYELFSSIPTLDESKTVTEEIFAWNETMKTSSKSRLFRDGVRQTAPAFGLSEKHILTIERLAFEPEAVLGDSRISDQFDPAFFETNFWFMWVHDLCFPALAQRRGVQALSGEIFPHGCRFRPAAGNHAYRL